MLEVALKLTVWFADSSKVQSQGCVHIMGDFESNPEFKIKFEVLNCYIDYVSRMPFVQ